jgi:hypothetical protein
LELRWSEILGSIICFCYRHAITQPEDGDEEVEKFKDVEDEMVQEGDEIVGDGDEMVQNADEAKFFQGICEGIAPSYES